MNGVRQASAAVPKSWLTAEIAAQQVDELSIDGHPAITASLLLKDGTNVVVLAERTGARCLRMGPDTDWAIQEHIDRKPHKRTRKVWKVILKAQIEAKGGEPTEADEMWADVLCNDETFEREVAGPDRVIVEEEDLEKVLNGFQSPWKSDREAYHRLRAALESEEGNNA